jgi:SagB-type dehydrogenase family enzyme
LPGNDATEIARRFHDLTTHTPRSVRTSGHTLDWDVKPFPFKVYTELPALPLPRELDAVTAPTLTALAAEAPPARLTLEGLATVLYYAAGVTKKKTYPGGVEVLFRAAASTGALYQTEVYVVAGEVDGLDPGLYHFCPGDFALRRLRAGDVRGPLAEAAADPALAGRAATLVFTAIYWRNTWKYQARGYRHLFWDSGTILANALAVAGALGLAPRVLTGFVDRAVNHLVGLDPDREAALELLALGPGGVAAPALATVEPVDHPVMPLSSSEVDYPLLREIHHASMLVTGAEVRAWRGRGAEVHPSPAPPPAPALVQLPARQEGGRELGETIQRRGSTRQFGRAPLSAREMGTALWAATRPISADVPPGLVDLYLVVSAVEGIEPGSYAYRPSEHALEPLRAGDFRGESSSLCLEQALGGDAAAVIYFLSPLGAALRAFGNRGYRLANLAAGLGGGRAYLAAYALGFGASGLTFYDGRVVDFFSPHAAGKDAVFVTALGRARRGASDTIGSIPLTPKEASR